MATAPISSLPVRPGSFDPTLELPAITVEPDLRSTFAGWDDASRAASLEARIAVLRSGTTRWTRRLVLSAVALAAIQLGAHAIVNIVGAVERSLDHTPRLAAPEPTPPSKSQAVPAPSTTIAPITTTTTTPSTTIAPTSTLPPPESGPALTVAVPAGWVTPAEASRLREGMTCDQIVAIVGSPGFRNDTEGRGDGVDYLDDPALNTEYQQTRSTVAWETWRWPKDDLGGQSVALWVTFRAGRAVEIESR
jgi:hypothetical protein